MNVSMLILLLSQFHYLLSCCVGCMFLFVYVRFPISIQCRLLFSSLILNSIPRIHISYICCNFFFCKVNTMEKEQKYWRQKNERNPTIMNRTMLTLLLFSLLPISCILMMLSRCFHNDEPKTQAMNPLLEWLSIPHTICIQYTTYLFHTYREGEIERKQTIQRHLLCTCL